MTALNPKECDLRDSGLSIIGAVPWGTHFCQFYQTREDLAQVLVPYFKAGLVSNEYCMWVTSEPLGVEDAKKWLSKMLPDTEKYIERGQLEIIPYTEWYYIGGKFDADRVLKGWVERHDLALKKGYDGLRLTGNTFWLEKSQWQSFSDYERVVDGLIKNYRMIALCSYALDLCNAYEVIQVVSTHQFALIKESGDWNLIKSSARKLMLEELKRSKEELEIQVGERTRELADKSRMLDSFFTHSITPMAFLDKNFNFIRVNNAYAKADERSPADFMGHNHFEYYPSDVKPVFEEVVRTKQPYFAVARPFEYAEHPERGVTYWDWTLFPILGPEGEVDFLVFSLNDVTERVRAEEELKRYREHLEELAEERTAELRETNDLLRKSEEKFRIVADNTYDWEFWLDPEGRYIYVSPSCTRISGHIPEEFLADPGLRIRTIHPEDRDIFEEHLHKVERRRPGELEYRIVRPDGGIRWMGHACQPVYDSEGKFLGTRGSNRDITESKGAEEALRETTAYLQNLFDYANAPIIVWDQEFKITRFNHAFERLSGYAAEEVQGKELHILFPADTREESLQNISRTLTGEFWQSVEIPILRKDGERRIALWNSANIYSADGANLLATIAQGQDITERKEFEEGQRVAVSKLEAANRELESFSYSVSHDLRVPLRAVDGFARLLREEYQKDLPPEAQHYLQTICDSSLQMGRLIDDLLAFSRLGRQALNKTRVQPSEMVRQLLAQLKGETDGRNIRITIGDLPACEADPGLLKQVFVNLVSNALKFTRKREIAEIEVGGFLKDGRPAYFVKDNGVGFDMAYADKLFGVFQRLHRPEEYEGTGVGLAIVKRIVVRHGGEVWAEAELDKGAVFYFTL